MLKYNLPRLFKLKGISKPAVFLINAGFSKNIAYRLVEDKINSLSLKHIEKLCIAFKCAPNDLMEWIPDKPELPKENVPLSKLIGSMDSLIDLRGIGMDIPFDKLSIFAERVKGLKNDILAGK